MPPYFYVIRFHNYKTNKWFDASQPHLAFVCPFDVNSEASALAAYKAIVALPPYCDGKQLIATGAIYDDRVVAMDWMRTDGIAVQTHRRYRVQVHRVGGADDAWGMLPSFIVRGEQLVYPTYEQAKRVYDKVDLSKFPAYDGRRILEVVSDRIAYETERVTKPVRVKPPKEVLLVQDGKQLKYRLVDDEDEDEED